MGMATYIILNRFSPQAFRDPAEFKKLAAKVKEEIKEKCPGINWRESYATLGRFDIVDVIETDNPEEVGRAAMIINGYGMTSTETLPAHPWYDFLAGL
jgi:uncharacterized protein with GYD domain